MIRRLKRAAKRAPAARHRRMAQHRYFERLTVLYRLMSERMTFRTVHGLSVSAVANWSAKLDGYGSDSADA